MLRWLSESWIYSTFTQCFQCNQRCSPYRNVFPLMMNYRVLVVPFQDSYFVRSSYVFLVWFPDFVVNSIFVVYRNFSVTSKYLIHGLRARWLFSLASLQHSRNAYYLDFLHLILLNLRRNVLLWLLHVSKYGLYTHSIHWSFVLDSSDFTTRKTFFLKLVAVI